MEMPNYSIKSQIIVSAIILSLVFIPSVAYGEVWYNVDWQFAKKITINSTLVNGTFTNFPIVVNITDADLLAGVSDPNGLDIVFVTIDNETKLNHDIESYDNSIGWLTAWVSIPEISDVTDLDIMMYYGDTGSNGEQNNTAAVWTDYHLVLHMGDDLKDSSGNNGYATNEGTSILISNKGGLGKLRSFDGINDYINVTGSYLDLKIDSFVPWTVSYWWLEGLVNGGLDKIWMKKISGANDKGVYNDYRTGFGDTRACYNSDETITSCANGVDSDRPTFEDVLHLENMVWTNDGSPNRNNFAAFRNGTCVAVGGAPPAACNYSGGVFPQDQFINTTANLIIGAANPITEHLIGLIDEFRVANFTMLQTWQVTEYNNQQGHTLNEFLIFGNQGLDPNLDYDTIYLRLAPEYRNHLAVVQNTDITTDLDVSGVPVEVPITGTTIFMDNSFQVNGNGIECNFNGRVKVTASLLLTNSGVARTNNFLEILVDGASLGTQGASAYNRFASQDHSSNHVTALGDCNDGDIITITTLQEGANAVTTMATAGSSTLIVERLGDGGGGASSSSPTSDGHIIADEGTALTQRSTLDFVGAGVTATDSAGKTIVTIPVGADNLGDHTATQNLDMNGNWVILALDDFIILDDDGDTGISADVDDRIDFTVNGEDAFRLDNGFQAFLTTTGNIRIDRNNLLEIGVGGSVGQDVYIADNDAAVDTQFASYGVIAVDSTAGAEETRWKFTVKNEGNDVDVFDFNSGCCLGRGVMNLDTQMNANLTVPDGNLIIGSSDRPTGNHGTGILIIEDGLAPNSIITDSIQLWADNATAELYVMDEAGNQALLSPHNFDHVERKAAMDWATLIENPYIGKGISVSWFEIIRALEQVTGKTLLREYDLPQSEIRNWNTDQITLRDNQEKIRNEVIQYQIWLNLAIDNLNSFESLDETQQKLLDEYQKELNDLVIPKSYIIQPQPAYFNMIEVRPSYPMVI